MMRTRLSVALLAAVLLVPTFRAVAAEPFRFPEAKHGKGELRYVNGIPLLTVEGTPEEIGEQVGALALKPGARVLDYPKDFLDAFGAGLFWKLAVGQGKAMVKNFPADYHKEMEAMAKSSGAPWDKVVAGNTIFDIKKIVLCSALMVERDRSATRGPLLGRNLDYPSLGYINEYSLVTVYRPKGKHAFVSVGFPGLTGVLSGMNDAGLSLAVLEVLSVRKGEGRFNPQGIPYGLCFRKLLEECTTIEEAKKKLEELPRTTILNLVIADKNGVGVFEITPKSVELRKAVKGTASCTNHFCTALKPEKPIDVADSFDRFDLLEKARALRAPLTVEDVRKNLDAVNLGRLTLQTMVFEPSSLKLHVGFGKPPASANKLHTLDLAPLLKGEHRAEQKDRNK